MTDVHAAYEEPDRRMSRRRLLATGAAVAVAGFAGCSEDGPIGDGAAVGDDDPPDRIPGSAALLATVDPSLLQIGGGDDDSTGDDVESDGDLRESVTRGALAGVDVDVELGTLEAAIDLDASAASELTFFGSFPDDEAQLVRSVDAVVDAEASADEVVASAEAAADVSYEESEGAGDTALYEAAAGASVDLDGTGESVDAPTIGAVADGRYAIGGSEAVADALAVGAGEAESADGPIVNAYDRAAGATVVVAYEPAGPLIPERYREGAPEFLSFEAFDAVEAVGRSIDVREGDIRAEVAMHAASEDDAQEIVDVVTPALSALEDGDLLEDEVDDEERAETFSSAVAAAEVSADGSVASIAFEGALEEAMAIVEEF